MLYKKIGKLNSADINFLIEHIKPRNTVRYHNFPAGEVIYTRVQEILSNIGAEIGWIAKNGVKQLPVQKIFYSPPGTGFTIHKDGTNCKSALNIALSSNHGDWVRWYSDEIINRISPITLDNTNNVLSRNTDIRNYHAIPFIDELQVETGDVYILNTDVYHSFWCKGPKERVILQTKFKGNPEIEVLDKQLSSLTQFL